MDITFKCHKCGQSMEIDGVAAGHAIDCPKCGKPVYVPSTATPTTTEPPKTDAGTGAAHPTLASVMAGKSSPVDYYSPHPTGKGPSKFHPAIASSLWCLLIYAGVLFIGLFLESQKAGMGVVCYLFGIPFTIGTLLCAIYGMCKGQIKYGLLLLAGVSLVLALSFGSMIMSTMHAATAGSGDMQIQTQQVQKQLEQMLKQFSQ